MVGTEVGYSEERGLLSDKRERGAPQDSRNRSTLDDEAGIIVVGGRGCLGRGCLFWLLVSLVLSVILTVLVDLFFYLLSGPAPSI